MSTKPTRHQARRQAWKHYVSRRRRLARREAARLRCMSDQRFADGRWYRMEDEASDYWIAKAAEVGIVIKRLA